jgi:hypothetical protein
MRGMLSGTSYLEDVMNIEQRLYQLLTDEQKQAVATGSRVEDVITMEQVGQLLTDEQKQAVAEGFLKMMPFFEEKERQKQFLATADAETLELCYQFHPKNSTLIKDGPDQFSLSLHNLSVDQVRKIASVVSTFQNYS